MDRARFETMLAAYGADVNRWPQQERAQASAFLARHRAELDEELKAAQMLDALLSHAAATPELEGLSARILAAAPRRSEGFDRRAWLALAACAVFGVLVGYGGGLLAPTPIEDDSYFAMAFEAPIAGDEG